jgi:hypothetical protein
MKLFCATAALTFLVGPLILRAQQIKPSSEILSHDRVTMIINEPVRNQFSIRFPIVRVYKYTDKSGQYYCVLTEKFDSLVEKERGGYDTLHYSIRAIDLKYDSGKFQKIWEINDHAIRDPGIEGPEQSIWFWTRYVEFADFDDDGLIEPIIVYGSRTDDDVNGGRVKFIIYCKGRKVALRHHDSDLDEGRSTQFDPEYRNLPPKLKARIKAKMIAMDKDGNAIFDKTSF